jgi:hypothetical protein
MGPNFIMFLPWRHCCCLKAEPLLQRHLTAEPSNRMLTSLSHCFDIIQHWAKQFGHALKVEPPLNWLSSTQPNVSQ